VSLKLATSPDLHGEALPMVEGMRGAGFQVELAPGEGAADPTTEVLKGDARLALVSVEAPHPLPPGLTWAGVPKRIEPRDVLVPTGGDSATLGSLAPGTQVGVAGARRRSFLRAHRPDVEAVALINGGGPGAALSAGTVDAAIVAASEVRRSFPEWRATEILDPKAWIPGACQGATVLLAREDDEEAGRAASSVEHSNTRTALLAETSLMEALELTCAAPMGVVALPHGGWLRLWAMLASDDGRHMVRGDVTGLIGEPHAAGLALAALLMARGAAELLERGGA